MQCNTHDQTHCHIVCDIYAYATCDCAIWCKRTIMLKNTFVLFMFLLDCGVNINININNININCFSNINCRYTHPPFHSLRCWTKILIYLFYSVCSNKKCTHTHFCILICICAYTYKHYSYNQQHIIW